MKRMILCAVAIAAVSAPALADPVWEKVDFGMKRPEIESMYPKRAGVSYQPRQIEISDIHIMEKCDAEANIFFDETNSVDRVMIAGNPSMSGRCSRDIMAALASKYGQPSMADGDGGSLFARQGKLYTWVRPDGVTLQFKKFENGVLGGGGLTKASWQLTYTRRGASLTL